ncbi:hypothetical protein [Pseudalkalibacillus berkeleyi]|uniref:DUF3139 domain-containing protein n=1 Tax=Pseudalkalibacillus berkeleyi TaxID=1069813 RepID=A0ABS9H2J0_9BACL|nr:hypothetical protein [Pseudalkalibacillus berkeleyi]MCF6139168.1 hypothetical protein [Pseudalkalibacillus berkeleyi]
MMMAAGVIAFVFLVAIFVPKNVRKVTIIIATSITMAILLFFAIRPIWYEYQITKSEERLNHYLSNKYASEDWKIERRTTPRYNAYQLNVTFQSEKEWTYTYYIKDEICQISWSSTGLEPPSQAEHYEPKECDEP